MDGGGMFLVISGIVVIAVVVVGYMLAYLTFLKKVGPNEVLVVSGRGNVKFITGGADMVIPLFNTWDRLSLEIMTLDVITPEVMTAQGVPVIVDGVAQIKVKKDEASLHAAAERFLGKAPDEIAKIALETVQGHLRAILGRLTVEEIIRDRDKFAQEVQSTSAGDLGNMGLGIDSFVIRDIQDKHGYLEAIGKPKIAEANRDAAIAQANATKQSAIAQADAERETRERQAQAQRLSQEAEAQRDASIAEAVADKDRRQREAEAASRRAAEIANFQALQAIAEQEREANLKKANADMAYELQKKSQEILVQEQEIQRREKELDATIRRAADAKAYEIDKLSEAERKRLTTIAEGDRARGFAAADVVAKQGQAEADANKARGLAEADVQKARGLADAAARQAQGLAEALAMEKKAEAWQKYNEAAVLQILAPILPEIARAMSEPLSKIDRITMVNTGDGDVGVSRLTGEMAKMIAQVPPVLESLTGLQVSELLEKIRPSGGGATAAGKKKGDAQPSAE